MHAHAVALVVGNHLDLAVLEDGDARVGRAEIHAHDRPGNSRRLVGSHVQQAAAAQDQRQHQPLHTHNGEWDSGGPSSSHRSWATSAALPHLEACQKFRLVVFPAATR
jgi:hypothetical protein